MTLLAEDMSKYFNHHIFVLTAAIAFLSFVVLDTAYSVCYGVYASPATGDSNIMNTTMMEMMKRGNIAMGFNQNKIAHNFVGTPDGGEIIITALNDSDIQTINQIKNHTIEIQKEFSQGNFTKPFFIHAQDVPGTKLMSEKKDSIKYDILDMKNGSALVLSTNDTQLIDSINHFMEFQAREHRGH
ncbi:MAG: hypothetical protein ACM3JQ_02575 [Candidatus Eiseniibacteriota bacterium]